MTSGFDWLLYLDVADHLMGQSSEEFLRSATSRAYYGVFCSIRDLLVQSRGRPFANQGSIHGQVINALKGDQRREVSQVGIDLDRLRLDRNLADYRTNRSVDLGRAHLSLLRARQIRARLQMLKSAFASP